MAKIHRDITTRRFRIKWLLKWLEMRNYNIRDERKAFLCIIYNTAKAYLADEAAKKMTIQINNSLSLPFSREKLQKHIFDSIDKRSSILFYKNKKIKEVLKITDEEYERLKDSYELTAAKLAMAKEDLSIMHPLPRVTEINVDVDDDPRACYFKQVLNGKYMRMALILKLLESVETREKNQHEEAELRYDLKCKNYRCITTTEQELRHVFKLVDKDHDIYRCIYCEAKAEK